MKTEKNLFGGYVPPRAEDILLRYELNILSYAATGDDVPVDPSDPWLDDAIEDNNTTTE